MVPFLALKSIGRIKPGKMLDIGSRDGFVANSFAKAGYQVHAIDPNPPENMRLTEDITFEKTSFEAFESDEQFDLIVASNVSQFLSLNADILLERFRSILQADGVIYVNFVGPRDDWADEPKLKSVEKETIEQVISSAELEILYFGEETFNGPTYDGQYKNWHLYSFVLTRADANRA